MSINLCIDWGNTNIKAAVIQDDKIQKQVSCTEANALEMVSSLISLYQPEYGIMSAVAKHSDQFVSLVKSKVKHFIKVDGYTKTPINNAYLSADTLGADRLALVVGAYMLHGGKDNLVVSLGTCITYNLIQQNKTFRGGAISPGLHMRLKAMHKFTDGLPEVKPDEDALLLGYDTETCLQSGATNGMAAEIDGMITTYSEKYTDFNAILTGGDAPLFARKLKSKIFADPDLLLKGLNLILNYNVASSR
ncbi:MAG: type III pantothenate kinase [Bacteroidota bacterium]